MCRERREERNGEGNSQAKRSEQEGCWGEK